MEQRRSVTDMSREEWAAQAEHRVRVQCHADERVSSNPADWLPADKLAEAHALAEQLVKVTRRTLNTVARDHDRNALPAWLRNARFDLSDVVRELRDAAQDADTGGHLYGWHRLQRYAEAHAGDATVTARMRLGELAERMRAARDTAAQEALDAAIAREVARRNSDEGWEREQRRRDRVRRGPSITIIDVHDDGTSTVSEPRPYRAPDSPMSHGC